MSRTGPQNQLGRRDANESKIITAFESMGCPVEQVSGLDLIVGIRGQLWWIEVKNKDGKNKFTDTEKRIMAKFERYPVAAIWTVDEAVDLVNQAVPR